MKRHLGSQNEDHLRRGPCMARQKHGALKMAEFDLLRTLAIRNKLRNKTLRSARCDCVLKPFKNVDDYNHEDDRLEIVRSILACSDENLFSSSSSSVTTLLSDWLLSIHNRNNSTSNNNVVQELILPIYWLSSSPCLRVEILTLLVENLDYRAKRISLPMSIAHGAVEFAESICDCVCATGVEKGKQISDGGDRFNFSVLSEEESNLLEMFVAQVCRLLDNQKSNEDVAMNGDDVYISKWNKYDCKYEDSCHEQKKAVVMNSEDDDAFVASSKKSSSFASSSITSGFNSPLSSPSITSASSSIRAKSSVGIFPSSASHTANNSNNNDVGVSSLLTSQSRLEKVNEDVAEIKPPVSANVRAGSNGGLFESAISALYATLSQACNTIDLSF